MTGDSLISMSTHIPPLVQCLICVFRPEYNYILHLHPWKLSAFRHLIKESATKECSTKRRKASVQIYSASWYYLLYKSQLSTEKHSTFEPAGQTFTWCQYHFISTALYSLSVSQWRGQKLVPRGSTCVRTWNKSDKKEFPYLDALNASFAVVAFDVHVNLCVANKAEWQRKKNVCLVKLLYHFFIKSKLCKLVWLHCKQTSWSPAEFLTN